MATALVNGIAIEYDEWGGGDDVLVLVHGHPFDRSMWRGQGEVFGESGWRVIAADLRGYGRSSVVPGVTTLETFARDTTGLLDQLHVETAVVGGLSMGGQIVMEICRLFPDRVRGVLLAATTPQAETVDGKTRRNQMADRLLREGMDGYAAEALPMMLAQGTIRDRPEIAERVRAMMRAAHPDGAAAALRGRAERPSYEETLAALNIPAVIIVGDQDAFTTRADAERMQALVARSTVVWMSGVGHMPNLERPDEFNAALEAFLNAVRGDLVALRE
jgi:pimeloyl-ACP methyl ester carboxylesterase